MILLQWFVVILMGLAMGTVVSFLTSAMRMPQGLALALGVVGAMFGSLLNIITDVDLFGAASFYISGAVMAIGFLTGGSLAYGLTRTEKRV